MLWDGLANLPIVGVVGDFHTQDFHTSIDPVAFMADKENMQTFNIKLEGNSSSWQHTLKIIEKKWDNFYPSESFAYKFYDDSIAALYKDERNLATLINFATGIAIFVSSLGLFGMVVLSTYQRTKEIGIRKVLGASISGIVGLLSKDYLKLIVIAFVVAAPIAWWAMEKWLQNFVYKIELRWWMFALVGVAALLVALLTVGVQTVRAALANPVKSLRSE